MAVALEFFDFIVPIAVIRQKYPGGWEQCLKDHATLIGGRVWYDQHLLRDGAMSPGDIGYLVDKWEALGFQPMREEGDNIVWQDCCIVQSLLGGPTLPCDWIAFSEDGRSAYLKGQAAGDVMGRQLSQPQQQQITTGSTP